MRRVINIGLFLSFSSCATLFNSSIQKVDIMTTTPAKIILNNDTLLTVDNHATIQAERNGKPLKITITNNNISKNITLKSRNSFAFWLNVYPIPLFGTGFLIDWNNSKRYAHRSRVFVNMSDSSNKYILYDPRSRKGNWYLHLSIPHINSFLLKPDNESYKSNTGFWGIAIGLDYYHSSQQFINIMASVVMDFFVPVPATIDISGEYALMSSSYIGLSNNHKLRNFTFGYGFSLSRNTWDLRYSNWGEPPPSTRDPITKTNYAIGFIFPIYYQFGQYFIAGLIYRPTIFRFSNVTQFEYEHLISVDFAWKLRLK